jgi:hypothetical protein
MLGLGTGAYIDLVEPDYTLSAEEICKAVVIRSVERTGTLEFLSHLFPHQNAKLPSFIPNWTGFLAWRDCYENRLNRVKSFNASRGTLANIRFISDEILVMPGIVFDVVTATCSLSPLSNSSDAQSLNELHQLAGVDESIETIYGHTNDSRLVALWHSLCGGIEMVMYGPNPYSQRFQSGADLSKY